MSTQERMLHLRNRIHCNHTHILLHVRLQSTLKSNSNVTKASALDSWKSNSPQIGSRQILNELWPLIWPKNDWKSRAKVCGAMSLLLGGKVHNICLNMKIYCVYLGFKCTGSDSFQGHYRQVEWNYSC